MVIPTCRGPGVGTRNGGALAGLWREALKGCTFGHPLIGVLSAGGEGQERKGCGCEEAERPVHEGDLRI
jgi:hypothetical protein